MKANELRVGNYIELDGKVESIWEISLDYYDEGFPYISSGDNHIVEFRQCRHKPIPLDQEWLEKFGFEKLNLYSLDRWIYNDFEIENMGKYFAKVIWSESCPHTTQFIGHHQYVHQLQNLYFALTGEELTIKS